MPLIRLLGDWVSKVFIPLVGYTYIGIMIVEMLFKEYQKFSELDKARFISMVREDEFIFHLLLIRIDAR